VIRPSDVPTCRLEERLHDVRGRVNGAGWDRYIVVNASGVVLGRKALASGAALKAATFDPSEASKSREGR
jgi:hypothetical protein